MPLERRLEPEVMDSAEEAADYDAMDHSQVNRIFVDDLLTRVQGSGFRVQHSEQDDGDGLYCDILDLGTGTALIPVELCKRCADCRVMATDAAVSMLELARYNIEVNSLASRIELAQVDAKRLPFAGEMFDVVMSNSIVHHIPEPIAVLQQALRVAKAGGLLFFRDLLRPESEADSKQLVATYAGSANEHQQRMFTESLHAALSLEEIRDLVASLGFAAETAQQTSDRHWTWVARKAA
jgi:ubiquinone/menaquinone biosynthesis C-methylase UbiE